MSKCEQNGLPYLMRLRLTKNVKRAIERLATKGADGWTDAGQGWQGVDTTLKLSGWAAPRRVVLLRRRVDGGAAVRRDEDTAQLRLSLAVLDEGGEVYEHAALVTTLTEPILGLGQLYRDRADCDRYPAIPPKTQGQVPSSG